MQQVIGHAEQWVYNGKNLANNGTLVFCNYAIVGWNGTIVASNNSIVGATGGE